MKVKFIFVVLIPLLFYGYSNAQGAIDIDTYDRETIYNYYSIFGNGFVKDGRIISLGAFGSNLAREMANSEYALEEMQKVRKYKIAGAATKFVATSIGITNLVLLIIDKDYGRTLELTSIITGGVFGMIGEGFNRASMSAMNRAVWLYNRDVATRLKIQD